MSNFIKIRPLGAEVFHADGQTKEGQKVRMTDGHRDMTNLIVALRNFLNAPKIFLFGVTCTQNPLPVPRSKIE
jgi:hypothetical protein